jgi:hypothetical protein
VKSPGRVIAGVLVACGCCLASAAADEPSVPAPHPDFQAMHVMFGRWACTFHLFNGKSEVVAGITELSSDGRRAVTRDPYGVVFTNLWYDAVRKVWIDTSINTLDGLDLTATSRGWSGGVLVFNGYATLHDRSLPIRSTTTLLSRSQDKTVEELQDPNGVWHMVDWSVCGNA